jgi:hypothetical protein
MVFSLFAILYLYKKEDMKLVDRLLFDKVAEKMGSISTQKGAGEVSYETLKAISQEREGWVGGMLQALLKVIESDSNQDRPEEHLQQVAAIALQWASQLQRHRDSESSRPSPGETVTVRVPEHRLRYLGKVDEEGQIFIEFLNRSFHASEVEIIPQRRESKSKPKASLDFQHAVDKQMAFLRSKVFLRKS